MHKDSFVNRTVFENATKGSIWLYRIFKLHNLVTLFDRIN